ncbi:heterokaryon incompatibility protein [Colletotrichum incanum]|uniref:Heterokaryon incompatibility protein n=1 Tax=Colletotrichum incanum TaxID=1573173 RepID=A0A161WI42_COLIC|nr:heterokaryon incompatibility protein [Colletotrichum incanum]
MLSTSAENAGASRLALYAFGAAVLAAPLAYHAFYRDADGLSSAVQRLVRPPPRYIHEPLVKGQFRLLHLLAGNPEDDVHVRLTVEPIDAAVRYHAVSYAWGTLSETAHIICEGREIQVTKSLLEALKRWRRADEEIVLWADSICIDQHNTLEKTHQVMLMAEIYSRAASVFVWLGSNDAHLDGIEDLISTALEIIPEAVDDPKKNRENAASFGLRIGGDALQKLNWDALRSLLNHTWFDRKWVYQEAILNDKVWFYCGRVELPFEPVSELALRMATFGVQALPNDGSISETNLSSFPTRLYNLSMMRASCWFYGKQPITLLDVVKATRAFKCTDPRDHILGILGLATDVEKDGIMSRDNLYSLPVQECYLRFAKSQLLEKRDLGILSCAPQKVVSDAAYPWYCRPYFQWQKRRLPNLPSWVPDLRNQEIDTVPTYAVRHGKFSAGGTQAEEIDIISDKILKCRGMLVDTVGEQSVFWFDLPLPAKPQRVPYPLDTMDPFFSRNTLRMLNFYKACVRLASGSESVQEMPPGQLMALWKTLTCEKGQLSDRIDVDLSEPFRSMVTGLDTWLNSEDPQEAERARSRFVASGMVVEPSVIAFGISRRLCRTRKDRLCMLPREARAGDVVCILLGSEVPFVIRPTRKGMYEMIGDAYVSGMMDGEALSSGIHDQVDVMLE